MDVAEIQARHLKAETVDRYFTEAGSGQVKEKVFCDAKTQAHADRGYLLKRIAELEAQVDTLKAALMDEVRDGVKAKLAALGGDDD